MTKLLSVVSTNQEEVTRFLKFAIVGAIGAVVDFGVLNLLFHVFDWSEVVANLVSVSCAIISNFTWNRLWTFPESRERALHTQFGQFLLVNLIGLGINELIFLTLYWNVLRSQFGEALGLNIAKGVAIIVVLFWNFFANRRWTYRGI